MSTGTNEGWLKLDCNDVGMSHGVGRQNICKDHSRSSGNELFSSSQNPKDNKAHVIPGSILYYHV